jgi:hypothetical protein
LNEPIGGCYLRTSICQLGKKSLQVWLCQMNYLVHVSRKIKRIYHKKLCSVTAYQIHEIKHLRFFLYPLNIPKLI